MPKRNRSSAGILLFRMHAGALEVLLVHPGGPFWARKNEGAWSIPKGEYDSSEDPLLAAQREFLEETGSSVMGALHAMTPIRQRGGKLISAWASEGDLDPARIHSNCFSMEWPPKSGRIQSFPEVDRASWFALDRARVMILDSQRPLLDELESLLKR